MSFETLLAQAVVNGLVLGMLYMLMAVGFTMAFGIMRVVNFAHGEFYMIGAFTAFYLVTSLDVPFLLALALAAVGTAALGALLERLVFRRFYDDELNGMIVALGLSVVLQNLALIVWGPTARTLSSPFGGVLAIGPLIFPWERLFALGAALAIFLAFWLLMARTQIGRAMRALAQDKEVALMQGVRANRVYPLAFALAVGMAAIAGVLMAPIFSVSPFAGHTPMLKAFVVVILGGLGSIPGAVLGGLLLGSIESLAGTLLGATTADILQLALVIGLLLFRPWGLLGQRERGLMVLREPAPQAGTAASGRPVAPGAGPKQSPRLLWVAGIVLTLLLVALPHLLANAYYMHIANMTLINVILVTGLNVISRTGQLSLCHAAFAGIGGYTSALLALRFGIPPIFSIFIGAAVAGVAAWLIGAVILRMRGVFFVLVTFLFGQIFTLLVLNGGALTEGANGLVGIPPLRIGGMSFASKADFYYFALVAAAAVVLFTWRLLRSPAGRAFASIEENLPLAESNGIDTRRFQTIAFVIGSSFAGFGGGAIAHYLRYISPDTFTFWESVSYIVMLVVGGRGTLAGGVVGALFLTPLPEVLRGAQALSHVAYGVILIAVLFVAPKGIAELGRRWRVRAGKPT